MKALTMKKLILAPAVALAFTGLVARPSRRRRDPLHPVRVCQG
ncbi:hypothetical protein [Brevibacterium aurantiacum]|nr:hypothetical protein [Brevibacterium aurantiacum]